MKPTIRFEAQVQGSFLALPTTASEKLSVQGKTSVEGTLNSLPFQSTLDSKNGAIGIKATKGMLAFINTETATIEITRIGDETETRVPTDLQKAIKVNAKVAALWKDITPLARRDWIFWVIMGKKVETRGIRIQKAISKMSGGMRRVCCFAGVHFLS